MKISPEVEAILSEALSGEDIAKKDALVLANVDVHSTGSLKRITSEVFLDRTAPEEYPFSSAC